MYASTKLFATLLALGASISSVTAHGALVAVTGANGVTGQGFGIDATTPRDGTRRNPFQRDTSIIRQREITSGRTGVCGRTIEGGNNDVAAQMTAAVNAGLPSASADGTVTMTLHQVNGDGAGPYTCDVSANGTGSDFKAASVITNVPGENSRSNAKATDFPLVVQMPAGTTCTGGPNGNACLVRCMNGARAGPFGGCAAVTQDSATTSSAAEAATVTVTATEGTTTSAAAETTTAATEATTSSAAETAVESSSSSASASSTATAASSAESAAAADDATDDEEETADRKMKMKKRYLISRVVGAKRSGQWM